MFSNNKAALELRLFPYRSRIILFLILAASLTIRLVYFSGLVFSDDSYYDQLAFTFLNGDYPNNYLGYPIFLLRKGHTFLTAFSFLIFGKNEIASVYPPLLFSISGIYLTYKFTFLYTKNEQTSLIAAFLMGLFPTDVIFATINFADLQAAFLMNLGLYFLVKSVMRQKIIHSFTAALLFFISALFKPVVLNLVLLITVFAVYKYLKERKIEYQLITAAAIFLFIYVIESIVYLITTGDFFYRFTVMSENFSFAYYDFFPNNLVEQPQTIWEYLAALFKQIFIYNSKYLFFRRFYLFVPFAALVISVYFLFRNEHKKIIYWFIGLSMLLMAFTTSLSSYIPMNLRSSWYMFPVFLPALILISLLISKLRWRLLAPFLLLYSLGSIFMISSYKDFFDSQNLKALKNFIKMNKSEVIYTDHHTKYGVDLLKEYNYTEKTKVINEDFDINFVKPDQFILYNKFNIEELKLQKYEFPNFDFKGFTKIASYGKFSIYKRTE